jgi:hypothetical protein
VYAWKPLQLSLRIRQINHFTLFTFIDEIGDRLQTLLDKKKADTATENLELEAIARMEKH